MTRREQLKTLLPTCTEGQQHMFKRMYAQKGKDLNLLPINEVIDEMDNDRLDTAIRQTKHSIEKNIKDGILSEGTYANTGEKFYFREQTEAEKKEQSDAISKAAKSGFEFFTKQINQEKMNITEDNSTQPSTKDLFEVLNAAKLQGIKAFRINEDDAIWPKLKERKELTEAGYKVSYGQYETDTQDTGFYCMVFFYPPKVNPKKVKKMSVELEVEYTSASFKEAELKKSLLETFNTWGVAGYQIKDITDL